MNQVDRYQPVVGLSSACVRAPANTVSTHHNNEHLQVLGHDVMTSTNHARRVMLEVKRSLTE